MSDVTDTPTLERGEPEAVRCVRRLAKDGRDMRWEGSLLREYDALRAECARLRERLANQINITRMMSDRVQAVAPYVHTYTSTTNTQRVEGEK